MDDLPAGGPSDEDPRPGASRPLNRRDLLRAVHLRKPIDFALRHESLWAAATVLLLLLLTWRPPWGQSFGALFEGRIADADVTAPFDVEIRDDVRTAERREQARRAVDDVYVFDDKAAARLEHDLQEGASAGSLSGAADPALAAVLRRGHAEVLHALQQVARTVVSERIVARRDTLPQGHAITVRFLGEPDETSVRDQSRIIDIEEAKRRVREAAGGIPGIDPALARTAGDALASLVQPNLTYDMGETRHRMDEAARQVPVL
jgi:membrane-associated HD superfamily phosphohydrolase